MPDTEWKKAKIYGANSHRASDWSYIYMVYSYLGGNKKAIEIAYNDEPYRLLGTYTNEHDIIYNIHSGIVSIAPSSEIIKTRKSFIDIDPDDIIYTVRSNELPDVVSKVDNLSLRKCGYINVYGKSLKGTKWKFLVIGIKTGQQK